MSVILPAGDDGRITRSKMPQIDDGDIPTLIAFLGSKGVALSAGSMDAHLIVSHQGVDPKRAEAIPDKWMKTPILLSKECAVIDGNHRWYRHLLDGTQVPFIRFEENFDVCLQHIFAFPKTYEETQKSKAELLKEMAVAVGHKLTEMPIIHMQGNTFER